MTYNRENDIACIKIADPIRIEPKHFDLDDVSSFITRELDKVEQEHDVYSTWYLSFRFNVGFVTHSRFRESVDLFRRLSSHRTADNLEEKEEEILKAAGFSWSYSFGLGDGGKHSYPLYKSNHIGDRSVMVLIPIYMKKIDWSDLINRSGILSDLDQHITGEWKERELIKQDLPGLLEKTYENGRRFNLMTLEYNETNEETKTYGFSISKKTPEIIVQKNREYQKQVEVKKKFLSDPIAMIHYYQSTHN